MRTYQKHVGLSMLSFLSCVSLLIPCQALGREKTFPADVHEPARKLLVLLYIGLDIEKISLFFPVGREKCGLRRVPQSRQARLDRAVHRRDGRTERDDRLSFGARRNRSSPTS